VTNDPQTRILSANLRDLTRSCLLASVKRIPIKWGIGDSGRTQFALTSVGDNEKILKVHDLDRVKVNEGEAELPP